MIAWLARRTCNPEVLGLIPGSSELAHQACHPLGVGTLVPVSTGVKWPRYTDSFKKPT